jgi:SAM-dependent methyltransferase
MDEEKLCPYCGSLSRTRRLWEILNRDYLRKDQTILDFSPSRSLRKAFRAIPEVTYVSTDLSGEFPADRHYDITRLAVESNSFDLVLCYHILEHVENDIQAMQELYRVLKKGGTCLIQTPFKTGDIDEDDTVRSEEGRLMRFGQKDHVRIYSAEGLKTRLERCGFQVFLKEFTALESHPVGYKTREIVLLCVK